MTSTAATQARPPWRAQPESIESPTKGARLSFHAAGQRRIVVRSGVAEPVEQRRALEHLEWVAVPNFAARPIAEVIFASPPASPGQDRAGKFVSRAARSPVREPTHWNRGRAPCRSSAQRSACSACTFGSVLKAITSRKVGCIRKWPPAGAIHKCYAPHPPRPAAAHARIRSPTSRSPSVRPGCTPKRPAPKPGSAGAAAAAPPPRRQHAPARRAPAGRGRGRARPRACRTPRTCLIAAA